MHQEEFRFRLEKTSAIISCLAELNLSVVVTESDLMMPEKDKERTREVLYSLYQQLAELCTGISREEMAQPALLGLSAINYPELHEDSMSNFNTFRAISRMMESCGVHSFTIKDLMNPDSKRTRRFLSGIINYLKFREGKLKMLVELNSSRDALMERLASQREKGETIATRLHRLRDQTAEDAKLISRVEEEIREIESQIDHINKQQLETRDDTGALKVRNSQLKETIIKLTNDLEEAQHTRKLLTPQVVSSPEKFRKRIMDAGSTLQNEQKEVKQAERHLRDLTAWISNVEESQVDVSLALETMRDFRNEVDRQKQLLAELEALKNAQQAQMDTIEEVERATQQSQRLVSRADDKLQHLRRQAASRAEELENAVAALHSQVITAENNRMQLRARAEKLESECDRVQQENDAEKGFMEQEIADMTSSYKRLERLVSEHLKSLCGVLQLDTPMNAV